MVEFLANWLVQGIIVVVAAATLLRLLHRARPHARYWMCIVGFSLVLGLPLGSPLAAVVWQEEAAAASGAVSPALVSLPHAPSLHTLIWAMWFVWVGACGVGLANATVRVVRTRGRFRAFPNAVEDRLRHWTQVKEQGRQTHLVLSDDVTAAAVIGGGAPAIAVAPALVEHLTADELDRVVIHEWAHVQRRDDIANIFQMIARLLVGWHPALWWFDRRLQAEREAACDETAVHMTGSSKGYAACLLKLASLRLANRHTAPALGVLSSATSFRPDSANRGARTPGLANMVEDCRECRHPRPVRSVLRNRLPSNRRRRDCAVRAGRAPRHGQSDAAAAEVSSARVSGIDTGAARRTKCVETSGHHTKCQYPCGRRAPGGALDGPGRR